GQRQRVAIGRAIVRDPKAFLFDEPLSNLDAELRVAMRRELSALHANIGGTMIYVTHDQTEAMTLADKIVVLRDGRVAQIGTPLELYNRPQNVFVAGFIGSPRMNLIETVAEQDGAETVLRAGAARIGISPVTGLAPGSQVTFGIRPEHIAMSEESASDLTATVAFAEQLGGETYLYVDAEGLPQLTLHQPGQVPVRPGQSVGLRFDRAEMHLFDAEGRVLANRLAP
ncbi:MAG: ABC transporter ATP-binding protein, partial [Pseudomonadota bacterium]